MVNFGLNAAAILGIFLTVAGAGLFFLRSVRPELARDYDIFFAAVGLLCGIILLFNGWRLDPILQFGQFLLTGTAIFFAFESIRMRGVATEQARRNTPTVDRDRPVSRTRVYTDAEVDKIDPYDDYEGSPNYDSPRLRGYDEPQPRTPRRASERKRPVSPAPEMRDGDRSRSSRNRPERDGDRYGYADTSIDTDTNTDSRPPRRRPAPQSRPSSEEGWRANDQWEEASSAAPRPRSRPEPREDRYSEPPSRPVAPKRNIPNPADLGRSYDDGLDSDYSADRDSNYDADSGRSYSNEPEVIPGDYVVDYQPLNDSPEDYSDEDYSDEDYDEEPERDRYSQRDRSSDRRDNPERKNPINFDY